MADFDWTLSSIQQLFSALSLQIVNSFDMWSQTIVSLSDRVLSFLLISIQDTLPHKANLRRWHVSDDSNCPLCRKCQLLQRVLNNYPIALKDKRYM